MTQSRYVTPSIKRYHTGDKTLHIARSVSSPLTIDFTPSTHMNITLVTVQHEDLAVSYPYQIQKNTNMSDADEIMNLFQSPRGPIRMYIRSTVSIRTDDTNIDKKIEEIQIHNDLSKYKSTILHNKFVLPAKPIYMGIIYSFLCDVIRAQNVVVPSLSTSSPTSTICHGDILNHLYRIARTQMISKSVASDVNLNTSGLCV